MNLIQIIIGIFIPIKDDSDEESDYELDMETTIEVYTGNALDSGEVKEAKAYDRYSIS